VSVFFRAAYRFGFKPWDSGATPPELVAVVDGEDRLLPGRGLDIGCGTGTNSIYLAQHGWDPTGIDFVPRAVKMAKDKAAAAHVAPRLIVGDVTRLTALGIGADYGLLLDVGCFHSIPDAGRDAYVLGVTEVARAGAIFLLFGFVRGDKGSRIGPRGLSGSEIVARFATGWEVLSEKAGGPMLGGVGTWYRMRRR
jgi:SAM-dependent methyltransferase